MKRRFLLLLAVVALILIVAGCISLNTNGGNKSIETPVLSQLYPPENPKVEINLNTDLYPIIIPTLKSNEVYASSPITVPTPAVGKTVFFGQMLTPGIGGTPYIGEIYLASLVHASESNQPPLIKFSEEQSPKAVVNVEGHFYFDNIDPGEYALIVYSLGGTYIISDDNGQVLYVIAEAGVSVDLGIVEIP